MGIVPFPTGPCALGSLVDNFQEFTSHELFETATNPEALGIGWNNLQRTPDNDIADFCAGSPERTTLPNNTSGTVARVVDNVSQTDCGIRSPSEVPPLSVVETGTNTINVFAQHGDGSLWSITGDGTNWSSPQSLGGVISEPPSAFSADGVTIDVFGRGMDGGLYRWFFDGAAWSGPFGLGGFIVGPPSAAYKAGGGKHVYVRGTDGVIYVARDGNIGTFVFTALPMPNGVQAISPPQVTKRGSDCLNIYFTGTDGHLYSSANCGDVPQPWADVGGTVLNQIGIAARPGDLSRVDVFANGPVVAGGAFPYQKTFGSSVNPFLSLGGVIVGPPSAVAVDTATIRLFARGAGGTEGSGLYQNVATDGSSWTGWGQLDTISLSAPPLAFSPDGAAIDLFMRNTAGSLVHKRFDGATWQEDQDFFFGLR